ncbi:MAG: transposase [Leptospirillum sp.]
MASSGRRIDFSSIQKSRIEKKERSRRRWQRTLFRQQKGSQNRKKTKRRLSRTFEYAKNVRKDVVHKATHAVASGPDRSLFVVEDLRVKNMTSPDGIPETDPGPRPVSTSRSCPPAGDCSWSFFL